MNTNVNLDISAVLGSDAGYGSYSVLGNLTVNLGLEASSASNYKLSLDIDRGVGGSEFITEKYRKIVRLLFALLTYSLKKGQS